MGDILRSIGIRWQLVLTQLIGFLIVLAILKTLLFDRIHKVLADRAAEEERRRHAIAAAKKEYEAAKARLEARVAEIEKQAYEQTQAEVRAGLKRKADLVSEALDKAREEVTVARAAIAAAHAKALASLSKDVVSLTLYVASRVSDRKLEGSTALASRSELEVAALLAARGQGAKA